MPPLANVTHAVYNEMAYVSVHQIQWQVVFDFAVIIENDVHVGSLVRL
jgi:hypothetical protein